MIGSNGVKIYLEQQKEILSTKESHYPFDHRLSEFINGTMEMRNGIHVNPTMYQTIQLNEEAAYPELANGHTGLGVILITEDHETIASYDESLNSQLTNNIFTPGSSFKPFAIAFLFSEGFIQKGQIVNDKKGLYALGTEKMTVKNGTDDIGPMTIEESLANSRNTGIQEIFKEYIEKNGIEGWNRFQNYLERLGIFICNEKGEKITNPLDPKNPSYTPVLGTGIGAYINSVTGSPMEAYTRAFSALADDRPFESLTEKERYSLDYVGDVISNTGYDQYTENIRVWSEKSIYLLAAEYAKRAGLGTISTRIKTGTVEEPDGSISGVLAFVTVESEGKTVTVGVNIRDFNQQGHYVDLTNAYNEESTLNALPTALSIAIESLKWELE
jgi:hypothetical protein